VIVRGGFSSVRETISSIVGAITLAGFVGLFVFVMNESQKIEGVDIGLMWFWVLVLIVLFLAIMGMWHSWFAPKEDKGTPPPH